MLKQLSILAALVAFGIGQAQAQKQEAVLQHIAVPGAEFDFVLAVPKPGAAPLADLGNMPDALVIHLQGGDLALVFDDARKMIETAALLQFAAFGFHVDVHRSGAQQPVAFYIVPKDRGLPPGGEMMTLEEYEKNQRRPVPVPSEAVEVSRAQAGAGPR